MGDLNIAGNPHDDSGGVREWVRIFDTLGRPLVDDLVDLWGRRQCTGSKGLRDPGITATVRYDPQEQRLDYIRSSAGSRLST